MLTAGSFLDLPVERAVPVGCDHDPSIFFQYDPILTVGAVGNVFLIISHIVRDDYTVVRQRLSALAMTLVIFPFADVLVA